MWGLKYDGIGGQEYVEVSGMGVRGVQSVCVCWEGEGEGVNRLPLQIYT